MERKKKIWWITWGIGIAVFSAALVTGIIGFLFYISPISLAVSFFGGFMIYRYIKRLLARIR